MKPIRTALAGAALLGLSACASIDTPLDGSYKAIKDRQSNYCAEASPERRAVLLAVIRSQVPGYPPSGLCTDADQAIADEIARRLAELPDGAVIDIEQAIEDQERFQE
ncbi:hypothetical protein HPA02_27280 [Bisbaumannia pacifica]|uniref:Lipoprotein n=1 Tax=Bisbaumannia pacifica TaxID=77098 RepID=A0A510XD42_9GAMM|nr:hypothetical protein [Halomonas pacifica]GEK48445.1 hypothetical protein HPA02_27280 [Halomonas pacifica]